MRATIRRAAARAGDSIEPLMHVLRYGHHGPGGIILRSLLMLGNAVAGMAGDLSTRLQVATIQDFGGRLRGRRLASRGIVSGSCTIAVEDADIIPTRVRVNR